MNKIKNSTLNAYVFTSSIPLDYKDKIEKYAIKEKIPKNQVLIKALELFFKEEKRQEFIEGVKKWGMDPENEEIAEWGMQDYVDQLKEYPA